MRETLCGSSFNRESFETETEREQRKGRKRERERKREVDWIRANVKRPFQDKKRKLGGENGLKGGTNGKKVDG